MWVNNVREGGKWDYKSTDEYGPYNQNYCSYYDGAYHDITAEWMGNYNYGYTGSYLFSLETLLEGSFIVSLFDMSDVYNDWPVIIAGYNAAQSEQSNIHPVSRWILFQGNYYYFDSDGTMATSWKKITGDWYYFNSTGIMQTGWLKYNSYWYYLSSSGKMYASQWLKYNGYWYYFQSTGRMAVSTTLTISGTRYTFDSSRHMVT